MNQINFGHKLAEIRRAKGLTQSELAEKCNVSYRTIQRIETGKVTPRGYTIKALSVVLDYNLLKMFSDDSLKNYKTDSQKFITVQQIIRQIIDLFNLKTKTMKKLSILTLISGLVLIGLTFSNKSNAQEHSEINNFLTVKSNESISQKEAVKLIENINNKVGYHNKPIELLVTYAKKSNYNYNTYVHLAKLISSFGYSTEPVMDIANIVFMTHKECDLFNDIASLIFLNDGHDYKTYVELAKSAGSAKSKNEINNVRRDIKKYQAQAKFKTLDEAFKNQ